MFPALVDSNHWVLAVIDMDGEQFIYYDPKGAYDDHGVIECAREWLEKEVEESSDQDQMAEIKPGSWPVFTKPGSLPKQKNNSSRGICVLYVAEHFERGVKPVFSQKHVQILRYRTVWILSCQKILDTKDP